MPERSSQPTDDALVTRAQAGDRAALVALYRRYLDEIYGYMINQLGHVPAAEDLTSETFLRVVRGLDRFKRQSSFRTWLYTIARNQLRDHWRRNGRRPTHEPLDPRRESAPGPAAEPRGNPQATALGRALLDRLPDNYRRVLELRVLDGRSVRDTAEEMETTPGNVKVMQHRALKRAAEIAEQIDVDALEA